MEFSAPATLDEALGLLAGTGDQTGVLAGGTDLIIQHRSGHRDIGHMIDIKKIPELNVLDFDTKTGLRLGAAVACDDLGAFAPAQKHYPGLVEGAELIGSTQIQSRASVGGNVCNGSPAADTICPLIVLEAVCVVRGKDGEREVAAIDFMTGPGQTALQQGELLVEFRIPPPPPRSSDAYLRFIPRNEMDIAVASAAVAITLADDGKTCVSAKIAIGAVGPTPILVEEAAAALEGRELVNAALEAAGKASSAAAKPITDMRGTVEYRVHMAGVLTRRAASMALERIQESD
ncbi:MAG: xanthine dehydrogenase family protein subunit M [SAR324 cluster bacterium]|nr:xanthine dehydrogenase family protein subunit M [SAR324 cluster bacterium]